MAALSLDEEARLYTTNAERERYESLATLFGIVVALDYLERAYVRDSVTAAEYVPLSRIPRVRVCTLSSRTLSRGILRHVQSCCRSTRRC